MKKMKWFQTASVWVLVGALFVGLTGPVLASSVPEEGASSIIPESSTSLGAEQEPEASSKPEEVVSSKAQEVSDPPVESVSEILPENQDASLETPPEEVPAAQPAEGETEEIATLLEALYANIPAGQGKVSYTQNYQSNEPEALTFLRGTGSAVVNNGLTVTMSADSVAVWDSAPWLSAGVLTATAKFASTANGSVGFVLGAAGTANDKQGIAIRADGTTWVIQRPDGSNPYATFTGPQLVADTEYVFQIGYFENKLLIAIDGTVYYNEPSSTVLPYKQPLGQMGLYKRTTAGTVYIKDIQFEGVGYAQKQEDAISYTQNYEGAYTPNWSGLNASVVTDATGNKVLELTKGGKERGVDMDSPALENGTLSLDFKLVSPATLGNGQGIAFGFRMDDAATIYSELGFDPNKWVMESDTGWGDAPAMTYPKTGKWNNLLINFKGKVLAIYLNRQFIGEVPYDKFGIAAGKLGLRVRSTVKLHIDNLVYTNKILAPPEIKEYRNDFQDGVTGSWSGGTQTILAEGNNKILKLDGMAGGSTLQETPAIQNFTLSTRIKPTTANLDVVFGVGYRLACRDGVWTVLNSTGGQVDTLSGDVAPLMPQRWNLLEAQVLQEGVTLYVNGTKLTSTFNSDNSFTGPLGFASDSLFYIDDLVYTEELLEIGSANALDKIYYEEYYETGSELDWTDLDTATISGGRLSGSIAAGASALNGDIKSGALNAVFQGKLSADSENIGIVLGDILVKYTGDGNWEYSYNGGGASPLPGKCKPLVSGSDFVFRVQSKEGVLQLYINGALVGEAQTGHEGPVNSYGLCNTGSSAMQVSIDALGAEELRIYTPTYDVPNWTVLEGTPSVIQSGAGSIAVNMPAVSKMVDEDAPAMQDFDADFDFSTNVLSDATGGRYGFLVRATPDKKNIAVVHDVNGAWRVDFSGNELALPGKFMPEKDKTYHFSIKVSGNALSASITGTDGKEILLGSVVDDTMPVMAGRFGLRGWWGSKEMALSNLKLSEHVSLPKFMLDASMTSIEADGLQVDIDSDFPRIAAYTLNGKTLRGEAEIKRDVVINGKAYTPEVTGTAKNGDTYEYQMDFAEIDTQIKAALHVMADKHVVRFEITEIRESGDFKVRSVSVPGLLAYADTKMPGAGFAWTKSSGQWHGITESLVEDLAQLAKSEASGTTIAIAGANGLMAAVENNVMSGGNKAYMEAKKSPLLNKVMLSNGTWTYRHAQSDAAEELPWYEVVITQDRNDDAVVDWQDGIVAYRNDIMRKAYGEQDMANNMMYIAFNFASQANDPFLNSLDTGKVLYNYTDGFGQMVLHKGYQAEGHDDDIPSYSNIGLRQGGLADFKTLIQEGKQYNMSIGVHLNATEYHLDANELDYSNLQGATAAGSKTDALKGGWDWIDASYYVDQTKDVLNGQLQQRFADLYNLTRNSDGSALDFYYIDVYTGNDYNAYKMLEYANSLGIKIGTEFAGPIEPGAAFVHWGPDLGYPNKGNASILSRMAKNNLDIFVGQELFKGQKIPGVTTWGDSKPDVQQGVTVFFNDVLPTKYMQHFGVMKYEEDAVRFEDGVTSTRNTVDKTIELKKDGKLIASWKDTSVGASSEERHSSESTLLIPWMWDVESGDTIGTDAGAKLYHWNPVGGSTTWQLTDDFASAASLDLYELTQQGRVLKDTIPVSGGSVTINAVKNTPYVLYPSGATAAQSPAAGNWGEGSPIKDFAFNSEKLNVPGVWQADNAANVQIKSEAGRTGYNITKASTSSPWNRYAEVNALGGVLSQEISGLEPGADYTAAVWTKTPKGRESKLEITVGGKTYATTVSGLDGNQHTSFKYRSTTWQRMYVKFPVPMGESTATLKLAAAAGTGVVLYDDARMVKHLNKVKDVSYPAYVVYEDFEDTYSGWGPFEYESGNLSTHIASDRSSANDNNPIVSAASGQVGPLMTWVVAGQQSLKVAERHVGNHLMSNEASVKLEANTTYQLGFLYTLEPDATYEVQVKSRSGGTYVLQQQLDNFSTPGDKSAHKEFRQEFTTDAKTDYQVIFRLTSRVNNGENATARYALMLDNFYVLDTSKVTTKTDLADKIDAALALEAGAYTSATWATLTGALQAAQAIHADDFATQGEIDQAAADVQTAIDQLVRKAISQPPASSVPPVSSLPPVSSGGQPEPPASSTPTQPAKPIAVSSVSLNMANKVLKIKGSVKLVATVAPANAANKTVTWKSSNTKIATVSSQGLVTAKSEGTTVITATASGKTAKTTIRVSQKYVPVASVKMSNTKVKLNVKSSVALSAVVAPKNANNKKVTWTSSNPLVASVSASGKVTAKSPGTASITVQTAEGGKLARCVVTVQAAVEKITLSKTSITLSPNKTVTLKATVAPKGASGTPETWSSSKPKVASVSNGKVKALSRGTATITVTVGNKKASCKVTVK